MRKFPRGAVELEGRSSKNVQLKPSLISKDLLKAFRSPADEKTLSLYTNYFDKTYKESGDFTATMKSVVSGVMASPRFIMVHDDLC